MTTSVRGWMLAACAPALAVGLATAQDATNSKSAGGGEQERSIRADGVQSKVTLVQDVGVELRANQLQDASTFARWIGAKDAWRLTNHAESDDLGAALAVVEPSLRAHLALPDGQGLVVVEVSENGRAAKAGLKPNDILLILADKPLSKPEDVLDTLKVKAAQTGEPIELKILRGGKPVSLKVKGEIRAALAPAAEEAPAFYIGTPANPLDATYRAHLDIAEGTGLIVGEIREGTPAAKAGIKQGDILLLFDGGPLPDVDTLRTKIQAKGPHPAKLQILRDGHAKDVIVTPERRKPEPAPSQDQVRATYAVELLNANQAAVPFNDNQAVPNGLSVLQTVPLAHRLFVTSLDRGTGAVTDYQPYVATFGPPQADLNKKIDELTAQVNALTKAVEALRAAQTEKK